MSATRRLYTAGVVVCVAALLGVGLLFVRRARAEAGEGTARREALAKGPRVLVAQVTAGATGRDVTLQGEVKAWVAATLYAKVSGYLREIKVDKGDRVKKGDLLATIESPEIDQQVNAAEADLAVKDLNYKRANALIKNAVVSQQELDNALAVWKVSQAALAQARTMQAYTVIHAPFDGVITARYADPGALLPAATGSTQAAQPLADLAEMDKLRIYVYLGQDEAPFVREGDLATVTLDERPDAPIHASINRVSRALDARSRTMLCEVDVDNASAVLYPGEFVHVRMHLGTPATPSIPAEALISRGDKLFVAVVEGTTAKLREVQTGLDDGKTVQVVNGLKGGEWVALNASGELGEETTVEPVKPSAR